jgi:hypothetical protein
VEALGNGRSEATGKTILKLKFVGTAMTFTRFAMSPRRWSCAGPCTDPAEAERRPVDRNGCTSSRRRPRRASSNVVRPEPDVSLAGDEGSR